MGVVQTVEWILINPTTAIPPVQVPASVAIPLVVTATQFQVIAGQAVLRKTRATTAAAPMTMTVTSIQPVKVVPPHGRYTLTGSCGGTSNRSQLL